MNMGLLQAAFYKPPQASPEELALPTQVREQKHQINTRHCEKYHNLVAWNSGIASVIHPNYLQVLTLPMQLSMMVNKPFPFKPMGLVHLANEIKVNELPEQNAELNLKTSFAGLQVHKRGYVFALKSEGFVDEALAIEATSFYLARVKHDFALDEQSGHIASNPETTQLLPSLNNNDHQEPSLSFPLTFEQGIGRRYASASGDYNPIHLSRWSAKLLGFRRAIAHGMYSKAICISMLAKNNAFDCRTASPSIFADKAITTQFVQPIYLPSATEMEVSQAIPKSDEIQGNEMQGNEAQGNETPRLRFSLKSQQRAKTRLHILGEVSTI